MRRRSRISRWALCAACCWASDSMPARAPEDANPARPIEARWPTCCAPSWRCMRSRMSDSASVVSTSLAPLMRDRFSSRKALSNASLLVSPSRGSKTPSLMMTSSGIPVGVPGVTFGAGPMGPPVGVDTGAGAVTPPPAPPAPPPPLPGGGGGGGAPPGAVTAPVTGSTPPVRGAADGGGVAWLTSAGGGVVTGPPRSGIVDVVVVDVDVFFFPKAAVGFSLAMFSSTKQKYTAARCYQTRSKSRRRNQTPYLSGCLSSSSRCRCSRRCCWSPCR